jgi:O-antigen/teichoic acid export membrane protein
MTSPRRSSSTDPAVAARSRPVRPGHALNPGRIAAASAWRLLFLAVQGGASVVLFAALGHLLSPRAFAATAVAQGVIVIAQSIGDFGLSQAAVAVLPRRIAAGGTKAELLSGAATAYIGAISLALIVTLSAVSIVPGAAAAPVAVSALASAAAVAVSGADGILRAQGDFRRPFALMAASELAGFAGVPVAAVTGSAFWTCAAVALGMGVGAAPAAAVLVSLRRASPRAQVRPFARASAPLGVSQVFIALATRVDTLLAGALAGLVAGGTFEGCWRVYQLSQYLAGGIASAAAPFIASALGAGRAVDALRLLRRLALELLGIGLLGGAVLYLLRTPIAALLAGNLGRPVAHALPALAFISPLAAVSLVAYYTLIGQEGQRRTVLMAIAAGAGVNLALAGALGADLGARGVVIGCAAGQGVTAVLLLAWFAPFARRLRRQAELAEMTAGDAPVPIRPLP